MSKIAEKKVMELGYGTDPLGRHEYSANDVFEAGVECYDQAMQDFLEYLKYCSTFTYSNGYKRIDDDLYNKLVEDFKNYMKNESEN